MDKINHKRNLETSHLQGVRGNVFSSYKKDKYLNENIRISFILYTLADNFCRKK